MPGLESLLGPVGMGVGLLADGFKIFNGFKQNHLANQINPVFNQYATSPYAKSQLGTAQQLFNAPMAGAADESRNIQTNQANAYAGAQRNATDSSQLLSLGNLQQGATNNAYQQQQISQAQNKYSLLNNLNSAYGTMINEGTKVYQSQLEKYKMDVAQQNALRKSGTENIFGGLSDIGAGLVKGGDSGYFGNSPDKQAQDLGYKNMDDLVQQNKDNPDAIPAIQKLIKKYNK